MKQMPVKGVKAGRSASHHGRETPGNTGLRGVSVHDMRPELPHFGHNESKRPSVIAQPDAATQGRHTVDRDVRRAKLEIIGLSCRQEPA